MKNGGSGRRSTPSQIIATITFTIGAPAKTSGATYIGRPPNLSAKMTDSAPAAPSAPGR